MTPQAWLSKVNQTSTRLPKGASELFRRLIAFELRQRLKKVSQ